MSEQAEPSEGVDTGVCVGDRVGEGVGCFVGDRVGGAVAAIGDPFGTPPSQ